MWLWEGMGNEVGSSMIPLLTHPLYVWRPSSKMLKKALLSRTARQTTRITGGGFINMHIAHCTGCVTDDRFFCFALDEQILPKVFFLFCDIPLGCTILAPSIRFHPVRRIINHTAALPLDANNLSIPSSFFL